MKRFIRCCAATAICLMASMVWAGTDWSEDMDKALETAKKDGKYLLVDFSGSDWCGWCIKLEDEVFSKRPFKEFAKKNLVTVLVDFPKKKKLSTKQSEKNQALATIHGVQGYPTVLLMDSEGKVIGRTGYQPGGSEAYVKMLQGMIAGKPDAK